MRPYPRLACGIAVAAFALVAAATKIDVPADAAFDIRIKTLESELRCLVCQNQTLADSNASLAEDLRREVRELALSGKSDSEIRTYLVARYGDFVLYDPPLKRTTWLLWIGLRIPRRKREAARCLTAATSRLIRVDGCRAESLPPVTRCLSASTTRGYRFAPQCQHSSKLAGFSSLQAPQNTLPVWARSNRNAASAASARGRSRPSSSHT